MPMGRRRGPGLVGTALVVGGAAHVGAKSANKQAAAQADAASKDAQIQQQSQDIAALQAQQAAAAPAAAAPAEPEVDAKTAELKNLASLHEQGVLTDEEFAAAKAKALGI